MAENLQLLKRRIKTAKNVSQIAKAMEMMSASKIKKAQSTVEKNKPYVAKLERLTGKLVKATDKKKFHHPYIDGNTSDKKLLIAISPDRGLCGSLNTNIFKALLAQDDKNTKLITIGKKVEKFGASLSFEFLAAFPMGTTIPVFSSVVDVMRIVNEQFLAGNVGTVEILFAEFQSFFQQVPTVRKILPVDTSVLQDEDDLYHLFEPNSSDLLQGLLPQYLEASLYSALLEAYTSEQVARMLAMQNAKTNANEIATYLTLVYNKNRQERITNEILDLSNNQVAV